MSHTNLVRVKTTNTNPRRGRGPGRGYQHYRNSTSNINDDCNSQHSKYLREENRYEKPCNPNENYEYSKPSNYRENRQGIRGHGNYRNYDNNRSQQSNNFREEFNVETVRSANKNYEDMKPSNFRGNRKHIRGQGDFKTNHSERETPKRSHSSSSNRSSRSINDDKINSLDYIPVEQKNMIGTDSSRLPRHAQHPIFVGELMPRFNNLLPSSEFLESEVHNSEQQIIMPNQFNSDNQIHSFASISKNIDHGFRKDPNHINPTNRYTTVDSGFKKIASKTSLGFEESKYKASSLLPADMLSGSNGVSAEDCKTQQYRSIEDKTNGKKSKNNKQFSGDKRTQFKSTADSKNTLPINFHQPGGTLFKDQLKPSSDINRTESVSLVDINQKSKQESSINPNKQQVSHVNREMRNQILLDFGFKPMATNRTTTNDVKTDIINNTHKPTTASLLFSEMEEFESRNSSNMGKTLRSNKCNEGETFKPQIDSGTNISTLPTSPLSSIVTSNLPSFELPRQIENYNSFIESQKPSIYQPVDERKALSLQEPIGVQFENINFSSVFNKSNASTQNRLEMTNETFTGGPHFNIQRTAAGHNQRVLSREEASQKKQDEYNVHLVEHEEKRKEKEAKKREQYLARYQNVDQGHRLSEGVLDEAAGYDPRFIESQEEARQRQQDQLRRDALFFREREREEIENRKMKEVENKKAWLDKQKHVDAGFRLGGRQNQGGGNRASRQQTRTPLAKTSKTSSDESNLVQEEDGFHDQSRVMAYAQHTGLPVSVVKPADSTAVAINSVQSNNTPVERKVIEPNIAHGQHLSALGSNSVKSEVPDPTSSKKKIPEEELNLLIPASCVVKNKTAGPVLVLRPSEDILNQALIKRLEVQDDMDKHGHSVLYKPNYEKVPLHGNNRFECTSVTESCKDTGAIPKQKTTLCSRSPVSGSNSPIVDSDEPAKNISSWDTGAISKQKTALCSRSPVSEKSGPIVDIDEQVKPVMDYEAEMRAARLRLQQQYEEALKKLQEKC